VAVALFVAATIAADDIDADVQLFDLPTAPSSERICETTHIYAPNPRLKAHGDNCLKSLARYPLWPTSSIRSSSWVSHMTTGVTNGTYPIAAFVVLISQTAEAVIAQITLLREIVL
jgi:hypothetical protein